jgi:hypothetical protein
MFDSISASVSSLFARAADSSASRASSATRVRVSSRFFAAISSRAARIRCRGQVEDGPRRRGHRDAAEFANVTPVEGNEAMYADARLRTAMPACDGDVDNVVHAREQAPEPRGAPVADDRPRPASEYGAELARTLGRSRISEQVNTAIKGVQPGGLEPAVDFVTRQADLQQLRAADDPTLPSGEIRDRAHACAPRALGHGGLAVREISPQTRISTPRRSPDPR